MTLSTKLASLVGDLTPADDTRREYRARIGDRGSVWTSWLLHGPRGVMEFTVRTGGGFDDCAWGIDAHHINPSAEDREWLSHQDTCKYTGGECWCDGSALQASELWEALRENGDQELIWRTLTDRYARWIERQED